MNVSGQSSAALVGEYLPATRGTSLQAAGPGLALPSGGAVLQRITVLATQPDDTVVMLRADYATPAREARSAPAPLAQDASPAEATLPDSRFAPVALYARTQGSAVIRDRAKGGVIDVHA